MRRGAVGALVVAAAAAWLPSPAVGDGARVSASQRAFRFGLSGAVTATWHGDPARGCASAGMCGYSGSAVIDSSGSGQLELDEIGIGTSFGGGGLLRPVVVRVRHEAPDGRTAGVCVDSLPSGGFPLSISPLGGSRVRLALGGTEGFSFGAGVPLGSGRCAGPQGADLTNALPSADVDLTSLGRRATTIDMSGRRPFGAGQFSGEVVSTVKLNVRPVRSRASSEPVTGRRHRRSYATRVIRYLDARLTYRIRPAVGVFVTRLEGLASPACRVFDVCGAAGQLSYRFTTRGGSLRLFGQARLDRRTPRGVRGAFAYVARHGRLAAEGGLRPQTGATTEQLAVDGETCTDNAAARPPPLDATRNGRRLIARLAPANYEVEDQLRTRCPGPSQADVLGSRPLAVGAISPTLLAHRNARLILRAGSRFSSDAFSGTLSGGIVLEMRRVHASIRVVRIRRRG